MTIKLWLDDERPAPAGWVHARSSDEAIAILSENDVAAVSFDHDLGGDDTGYRVACWLEERAASGMAVPEQLMVHSANPVGHARIEQAIASIRRLTQDSPSTSPTSLTPAPTARKPVSMKVLLTAATLVLLMSAQPAHHPRNMTRRERRAAAREKKRADAARG